MTFLKKALLFLVLLSLSASAFMYLAEPLKSLQESIEIYNNDLVCEEEIMQLITEEHADAQSFIKYNPLSFSKKLEEHPLIHASAVRTNIFPRKHYSVFIEEEKLWAFYRNRFYNSELKMVLDFNELDDSYDNYHSIYELYDSIAKRNIIEISDNDDLNKKDFKILKNLITKVNERLAMISQSKITKAEILDSELSLKNQDIKIIFGNFRKKLDTKLEKLENILEPIQDYISQIEYLDLSLNTNEAIIGKKDL